MCKCKLKEENYTNIRGSLTNKKKVRSIVKKMMGEVKKIALERHITIPR
jgi:hypothetical protein